MSPYRFIPPFLVHPHFRLFHLLAEDISCIGNGGEQPPDVLFDNALREECNGFGHWVQAA